MPTVDDYSLKRNNKQNLYIKRGRTLLSPIY